MRDNFARKVAATADLRDQKLLGGYKLWVLGTPLANGPGRSVDPGQQLYDSVDATAAFRGGGDVAVVALQAYRHYARAGPRK